jgi:flagellar motor switch protein FliN/FliY
MSDDNSLDQNEIERLLSQGPADGDDDAKDNASEENSEAGASEGPSAEGGQDSKAEGEGNALDQSAVEALFDGGGQKEEASTESSSGEGEPAAAEEEEGGIMAQDEIEQLLNKSSGSAEKEETAGTGMDMNAFNSAMDMAKESFPEEGAMPQGDLEYLLKRAENALDSLTTNETDLPAEVVEFQFPEFGGIAPNADHATLDQISEVELDLKIELGRTNMYLEDVLKLRKGSVVPLDKLAGDPVDIYINGRLLARGEVLVMNDNFCVRVAELLAGAIPME